MKTMQMHPWGRVGHNLEKMHDAHRTAGRNARGGRCNPGWEAPMVQIIQARARNAALLQQNQNQHRIVIEFRPNIIL